MHKSVVDLGHLALSLFVCTSVACGPSEPATPVAAAVRAEAAPMKPVSERIAEDPKLVALLDECRPCETARNEFEKRYHELHEILATVPECPGKPPGICKAYHEHHAPSPPAAVQPGQVEPGDAG